LSEAELAKLRELGERYCQPVQRREAQVASSVA
jgi:hypothetical protein